MDEYIEKLDSDKALEVLNDLDMYIALFEAEKGIKVTEGARKIIVDTLIGSLDPKKLN